MPDISVVEIHKFLCSGPSLEAIRNAIKSYGLRRVIVGACSPHMHERTFMRTLEEAGLNKYLLVHTNLREQCSWIHGKEEATPKAIDLVTAAVCRARELEGLSPHRVKVSRDILVIGGGIAGITSALHLADAGYRVLLVESKPSIGGKMAQLSKVFPTLDCSPCILAPKIVDTWMNPNITLLTNAEIDDVKGSPGNFDVSIRIRPRGVDIGRCTRCGLCEKSCPVEVPSEFEEGLYKRKAIYIPFPQAVPSAYVVDFENCMLCGACVSVCPTQAINLEGKDKFVRCTVGAMIVATGYELAPLHEFLAYKVSPDCVSALQIERLIENELAAGRVLKTHDGRRVKSIAYILCLGSRDKVRGTSYCSRICCPYSIKQAIILKEELPYLDLWIYYTDVRMSGRGFEEFYHRAKELGIKFVHGRPGEILVDPKTGQLEITAEDIDGGTMLRNTFDMVALCPVIVPADGTKRLAEKLNIPLGPDGFLAEKHPKLDPVSTLKLGIYVAGTSLGPKDIRDGTVDGMAAAMKAACFVSPGEYEVSPVKPRLVGSCDKCGNCTVCPYGAITLTDEGPLVNLLMCTGCGICVGVCDRGALELAHYTRKQLRAEVEGLLSRPTEEVRIVGFFETTVCYTTADTAGTSRFRYPHNLGIIRVPSTALLDERFILECLRMGGDAVLLCEKQDSKEAELVSKRVKSIQEKLERAGIEKERVLFESLMLPMYLFFPQLIEKHVRKIRSFGKLGDEARQKLSSLI